MKHRFWITGLVGIVAAAVLMGCSMADLLMWVGVERTVVMPSDQITPLPPCQPNTNLPVYVVASGDTLAGIAQRADTTASELARLNCLGNINLITVGQALRVPGTVAPPPTQAPTPEATIVVGGPNVMRFSASPQAVDAGGTVTFEWEVNNADSVTLNLIYQNGDTVNYPELPTTGSLAVQVPSDAIDRFTAQVVPSPLPPRGQFGEIVVTINPGAQQVIVITTFAASSTTAHPGESVSLAWTVSGANGVTLRVIQPDGQAGPTINNLPTLGNQSFTFPEGITGNYNFQLVPQPADANGPTAEVSVMVSE